jgi:hypothetical protein
MISLLTQNRHYRDYRVYSRRYEERFQRFLVFSAKESIILGIQLLPQLPIQTRSDLIMSNEVPFGRIIAAVETQTTLVGEGA